MISLEISSIQSWSITNQYHKINLLRIQVRSKINKIIWIKKAWVMLTKSKLRSNLWRKNCVKELTDSWVKAHASKCWFKTKGNVLWKLIRKKSNHRKWAMTWHLKMFKRSTNLYQVENNCRLKLTSWQSYLNKWWIS